MENKNKFKQGLIGAIALSMSILPSSGFAKKKQESYVYRNGDISAKYVLDKDSIPHVYKMFSNSLDSAIIDMDNNGTFDRMIVDNEDYIVFPNNVFINLEYGTIINDIDKRSHLDFISNHFKKMKKDVESIIYSQQLKQQISKSLETSRKSQKNIFDQENIEEIQKKDYETLKLIESYYDFGFN